MEHPDHIYRRLSVTEQPEKTELHFLNGQRDLLYLTHWTPTNFAFKQKRKKWYY